jgi:hypothetical protein
MKNDKPLKYSVVLTGRLGKVATEPTVTTVKKDTIRLIVKIKGPGCDGHLHLSGEGAKQLLEVLQKDLV